MEDDTKLRLQRAEDTQVRYMAQISELEKNASELRDTVLKTTFDLGALTKRVDSYIRGAQIFLAAVLLGVARLVFKSVGIDI